MGWSVNLTTRTVSTAKGHFDVHTTPFNRNDMHLTIDGVTVGRGERGRTEDRRRKDPSSSFL